MTETATLKILAGILVVISGLLGFIAGNGNVPAPIVVQQNQTEPLGSLTGPDITSDYLSVNNFKVLYRSQPLNQASTTICSFKSPSATSTLVFASVTASTGTTTAVVVEMAKSDYFDATTTKLASSYYIPTTEQFTIIASTTASSYINDLIFAPNKYFNVKYGGEKGSKNVFVGSCKAKFIEN